MLILFSETRSFRQCILGKEPGEGQNTSKTFLIMTVIRNNAENVYCDRKFFKGSGNSYMSPVSGGKKVEMGFVGQSGFRSQDSRLM